MIAPWRDPATPLGERCLLLAQNEMAAGVKANPYGQPNTGPRVREYLAGCVRDLNGDGIVAPTERLGLTVGNWCAAFQSWLLEQCTAEGEARPHLWRAGVVEIEFDAKQRGIWHSVEEVRAGTWSPNRGDLMVWDRSDPSDPSTAWWRHVNRFLWWTSPEWTHFETIGGNEQRTILRQKYRGGNVDDPKLLGCVSYYQRPTRCELPPEERARMLRLVAAAIEEIRKG